VTGLAWQWLGRAAYGPVWELQEELRRRVWAGDRAAERILFVEHEPVVTMGRRADGRHLLVPPEALRARGVSVIRTSRGGDVTYHGPGQLVVYPVVRLKAGVVAHVEAIAGAIVDELAAHGVAAEWRRCPTGVWAGDAKIAACGVHVGRRVAIHGFALNVTDEALAGFAHIVPCGLAGARVTSLARARGAPPPALDSLARSIAHRLCARWSRAPLYACDPHPAR
jgi:lipoate-protein ligase B